jgi:hypothetical protein
MLALTSTETKTMFESTRKDADQTRARNTELYNSLLHHQQRLDDAERERMEAREKARILQVCVRAGGRAACLIVLIVSISSFPSSLYVFSCQAHIAIGADPCIRSSWKTCNARRSCLRRQRRG